MNLTNEQMAKLILVYRKLKEAKARRYFDLLEIDPCADVMEKLLIELGEPITPAKDWSKIFTVIR